MSRRTRRTHSPSSEAKVALAAVRNGPNPLFFHKMYTGLGEFEAFIHSPKRYMSKKCA